MAASPEMERTGWYREQSSARAGRAAMEKRRPAWKRARGMLGRADMEYLGIMGGGSGTPECFSGARFQALGSRGLDGILDPGWHWETHVQGRRGRECSSGQCGSRTTNSNYLLNLHPSKRHKNKVYFEIQLGSVRIIWTGIAYIRPARSIVNGGCKVGVLATHEPVSLRNLGEKMKRWGAEISLGRWGFNRGCGRFGGIPPSLRGQARSNVAWGPPGGAAAKLPKGSRPFPSASASPQRPSV
jgi:hypothetical protein